MSLGNVPVCYYGHRDRVQQISTEGGGDVATHRPRLLVEHLCSGCRLLLARRSNGCWDSGAGRRGGSAVSKPWRILQSMESLLSDLHDRKATGWGRRLFDLFSISPSRLIQKTLAWTITRRSNQTSHKKS
jgi:hypothetical protein